MSTTPTEYLLPLTDPRATDLLEFGGKGASLARLIQLGHRVPSGFVIGASALKDFLRRNRIDDLISSEDESLRSPDYLVAVAAAKRVRESIIAGELSAELADSISHALGLLTDSDSLVSVRSSGGMEDGSVSSWAGQFDTFLQVDQADVLEYVKRCWASLFGSRAVSYGVSEILDAESRHFAVVVQTMVLAETSGVAFSVEPGGKSDRVLVEAVRGTGDALVSGRLTPYSAIVSKGDNLLLKRSFGSYSNEELLASTSLQLIAARTTEIEKGFGHPVDVEWALAGGQLYILQARPITVGALEETVSPRTAQHPDVLDYELTFKVSGLGFLFADVLARGFGYLKPLFTMLDDDFRQYFPNERMEFAAREGYRWLSRADGFDEYQEEFEAFHQKASAAIETLLAGSLSLPDVETFFGFLENYFTRYSKMDFQFTNLTFLYADSDPIVRENLRKLAEFKDVARVWINEVSIDEDSAFAQFLGLLSAQFEIESSDLDVFKISEISGLFDGDRVDASELNMRRESFAVFIEGGVVNYVVGEAAATYVRANRRIEDSQAQSEIVGQVANRLEASQVRGSVRLINVDYADLDKMENEISEMNQGEILVSEFTAPELLAACKKAAAIVTDLGGMLSHAAIVSRELGIPCVVGTRHASRRLKTGDVIVVDLESGHVEMAI